MPYVIYFNRLESFSILKSCSEYLNKIYRQSETTKLIENQSITLFGGL